MFTRFLKQNTFIIMLLALLLPSASFAAQVAIVNSAKIMSEYSEAKKSMAELSKAEAELKDKINAKKKEIQAAKAANKTDTELQLMAEQSKLEIEPIAKKLEAESIAKSEAIKKNVENAIDLVAKEKGYDAVLMQEAVLFGGTDISDLVIKKLESKLFKKL